LLGNGFSIACDSSIFTYNSLFNEADFSSNDEIKKAFDNLGTTDFELVIDALQKSSLVLPAYKGDEDVLCDKMNKDAHKIKELLINTIASRHPAYPSEISEEAYGHCRKFLSHFIKKDNKGRVYTLNYDLLLYWTLMHEIDDKESESQFSDGFGRDSWKDGGEIHFSDELIWQGKSSYQNIHYLHGGLHLYDKGGEIQKFSWVDTGQSLIDQSRAALEDNKFPLFVTEGDYEKKMEKIHHSAFLYTSFKSFEDIANAGRYKPGNTCLFTYGVSFSQNDKHIFNKIAKGKIKHLFVSIYGDINSEDNQRIVALAEALKEKRDKYPLKITYYSAESANVWG
jgi:hypothetical protein